MGNDSDNISTPARARVGLAEHPYPDHHFVAAGPIKNCQICNSSKLHVILDLGYQPLCDSLLSRDGLNQPETFYPLRMVWCEHCTGAQIDYCVDGKEVFHPAYPYCSGITKELAEYQVNISRSLIKKYGLTAKDLIVDIGSNDGTLLKGFQQEGVAVLGIEPTNIAHIARDNGIPTQQCFFDISVSKQLKLELGQENIYRHLRPDFSVGQNAERDGNLNESCRVRAQNSTGKDGSKDCEYFLERALEYGPASMITATNMFAHMQTIGEVIIGAHHLLKAKGVFVIETHYLLDVIQGGQFDTIYHEHLRTYSLNSLIHLFEPYDFTITDVERGSRYGGNIRIHVTKGKGRAVAPTVHRILQLEKEAGLDKLNTYIQFAQRVEKARFEFLDFLIQAKRAGKKIAGNSCPGRCSTLLNYYGIDTKFISYLAEQPTSLKLGMFLPGKHIPIVNNQILIEEQPDYVVLMAWHYAQSIMKQLKAHGLQSDFVIPLPDLRIIKNSEVCFIV